MKSKILIISILSLIFLSNLVYSQSANSQKSNEIVIRSFKNNDASSLSQYLNDPVDLTLPGSDNNYSRAQASLILKKFFKDFPVKSFIIHQSGKSVDGALFVIARYESTDGKKFKIYYLIKDFSGSGLVYLLEIEQE